jgi:SAM-dependent methyltransferase
MTPVTGKHTRRRVEAGTDLIDIVGREMDPLPWSEGEKIPWNDPDFSRRMLREHLTQKHDAASRRTRIIARHVDWIHAAVLRARPARILDLGCGPGLYTSRLARLGHTCLGIDFSPASIAYAVEQAEKEALPIVYRLEDIRQADLGSGYDLVMFIFGEFNVFRPEDARLILKTAHAALKPGGQLLLEVSTFDAVEQLGEQPSMWYSGKSGLFSDRPHFCLMESFWDAARCAATERYIIVDAQTAAVRRYAASTQAYTDEQYRSVLAESGFREVVFHSTLSGKGDSLQEGMFVILAGK